MPLEEYIFLLRDVYLTRDLVPCLEWLAVCEVLSNAGVVQCRVLAITCAMGLLFAPAVNAEPGVAPIPRQPSSSCDPNYSGACVPIASDVDCAGGSGNGPAYVEGPVIVIGRDIYGLDRDGNGIGCE
ncbi:hypothetical protein NJB1507_46150 [Mycobacterium marinum]|nr:hypothetical protein NJB1507_46150 [Mycobacterium marinum]